jgi:hypothetical protein
VTSHDAFGRDTHRYLDGEPHGELPEGERVSADHLAAAVRALAGRLPAVDAALDERVMAAVRERPAPGRRDGWRWLVEPRPVRIRPVWVPLALAAALALWLVPRALAPARPGARSAAAAGAAVANAAHDTVFVHFEMTAPDARAVAVAGSFNGWRAESLPMRRGEGGVWSVTIPLALGEYHYQFVVDGRRWVSDPTAHALEDDGFGGRNSVIVVGPKGVVRS